MHALEEWASISDLARAEGVDRAAVTRRVQDLEARGKVATRPGAYRSKLVNLAQYRRATGRATNATTDPLDHIGRRGWLGFGVVRERRLEAARQYRELHRRSEGGDVRATAVIRSLSARLGERGERLCERVLVHGHRLTEAGESPKIANFGLLGSELDTLARAFGLSPP